MRGGYWMFIFDHAQWNELYTKNCSTRPYDEWFIKEHASIPLGVLYLTLGIIFEFFYIPFIIAMCRKEFLQYSCYKFMFLMGIIDIFVVPCNGIITGIQCMIGAHFCTAPNFFYIVAAIGVTGYYGVIWTYMVLALNRFLEVCVPKVAEPAFKGKRVYFWLCIPIVYMGYTGFQVPHVYAVSRYSMEPDPFVDISGLQRNPELHLEKFVMFFTVNNGVIITTITSLYVGMLIVSTIRAKIYGITISKMQRLMTLQAFFICGELFICPLFHVLMLYVAYPPEFDIVAHASWISIHGDTPIIYLILNGTLRKMFFGMIFPKSMINKTKIAVTTMIPGGRYRTSEGGALTTGTMNGIQLVDREAIA